MLELKQQAKNPKSLRLRRHPYAYVRTAVMRALLFRKSDYQKMLKMDFSEIAKFLQESHYRKEINALATQLSGADLLELALNRNLAESFKKLMRISSYELGLLIREYAKRKDVEDLKTILRGKFTNTDEKIILNSITGAGTLSYDFLESLTKKDSVEEILKSNKIVEFSLPKKELKDFREKNTLVGIENALDRHYYSSLIEFSGILPKEGALFRRFLLMEVEVMNILTLLRLKKAKLGRDAIRDFIILSGDKAKDSKIIALEDMDFDALAKALEKTGYKNVIAGGIDNFRKTGSLIAIETMLYRRLLHQATLFMHQHPLSIDTILGYMLAKDIEIRNLKIIIKGKQLGLSEDFIESQLVFE